MSTLAAMGLNTSSNDWLIVGLSLFVAFFVLYPAFVVYVRIRHGRRIKSHLVTNHYKLPLKLTPVEVSYIFSSKITKHQLFATLLDLANRSIIVIKETKTSKTVSMGPKIDNNLLPFEKMLVKYVHNAGSSVYIDHIIKGSTTYVLKNGDKISGSRQYVFWHLLRQSLRDKNLIEKRLYGKYTKLLLQFSVIWGLAVALVPLLLFRFVQMLMDGELEFGVLSDSFINGIVTWAICFVPLLIVSFALLKFRGKMLGREWLLTRHSYHYLGQLDAYREFVRLVHKGHLRFDSQRMEIESKAETRPYAIALGYIKI